MGHHSEIYKLQYAKKNFMIILLKLLVMKQRYDVGATAIRNSNVLYVALHIIE